jgi:predicted amidophosphoribosyltransferase
MYVHTTILYPPGFSILVRYSTLLGALAVLLCISLLAIRRRTRPGLCRFCGYNLTGNVSGVCPECGKPIQNVVQAK